MTRTKWARTASQLFELTISSNLLQPSQKLKFREKAAGCKNCRKKGRHTKSPTPPLRRAITPSAARPKQLSSSSTSTSSSRSLGATGTERKSMKRWKRLASRENKSTSGSTKWKSPRSVKKWSAWLTRRSRQPSILSFNCKLQVRWSPRMDQLPSQSSLSQRSRDPKLLTELQPKNL